MYYSLQKQKIRSDKNILKTYNELSNKNRINKSLNP